MSLLKNRIATALASRVEDSAANTRAFRTASSRAFSRRNLLLLFVVAGALVALLLAVADRGRPAQAAAPTQTPTPTPAPTPDFTNVEDILNGRRHLLRNDDLAFVAETGNFKILQTTDSAISKESGFIYGSIPAHDSSATQIGRMFNLSTDVVVTLFGENPGSYSALQAYNPATNKSHYQEVSASFNVWLNVLHATKMADFNGDGYDDLVVNYGNTEGTNAIRIFTARDVNNFDAGLELKDENARTDKISTDAMTIGDFNGDGRPEIIGVIPQADGNGLRLVLHTVDDKTLKISDGVHFPLTIPEGAAVVPFIAAAAGQFTTTNHDQLLIAYATNGGTAKVKLIDFVPAPFQPQERSLWDTGHEIFTGRKGVFDWTGLLQLRVGRFNWSAQYDQPLLLHGNNFHRVAGTSSSDFTLSTLAINPVDFSIKEQGNFKTGDQYGTVYDLVLGNFDRHDPDPLNPQQKDRNPNLQAALLSTDYTGSTTSANIYNIDPLTLALKQATHYQFSTTPASGEVRFAAGDLQGRSMRLGEPTKVAIDGTTQPTVLTAAPPMHVDYIAAVDVSTPTLLNLSAIPDNFYTSYETEVKSSNQSSSTHTTSWSFGAKESIGASVEFGSVKKGDGEKYSDTLSAAQDLKGSTENVHGTYSTHSFDISQETGFSDQLWYSQSRFNIYIYPVIGQTVCPQVCPQGKPNCQENEKVSNPNCPESEKVPLTIQFSGPDQIHSETVAASQAEWYQPPWEYGNVLSYPGSYAQLQQIVPDIDKLSNDLSWATDASTLTEKTTWATGTSDSQSTSLKQNYSFENDFSFQGAASWPGIVGTTLSIEVDVNGSFGFSNLNKATTNLGKSTGIGVHKPSSFLDPANYSYWVTPYIFGHKQKGGEVDDIPLSGDVQTFGLLRTAFTVDPTRSDAGGWWKQAYTKDPDVALNHPNRWQVDPRPLSSPIPPNCLPLNEGSERMNCAEKSNSLPDNPWMSEFHDMRGLFISNITNGDQPGKGQGPQIETAKAGDKLALRTRVYNYSLKQMDADTKVHVRFYGMEWNPSNNCPAGTPSSTDNPCPAPAKTKASFLIGEDVLPPIPPFSSDPSAPLNWVLAGATFDTTPYADKYLAFWVVVWSQKADGKLTAELSGHGLTAIPAELKNLDDVSKLEEPYSNNVGFYKSAFYIFRPSNGAQLLPAANSSGDVRLDRVNVSNQRIAVGQSVEVSALLHTGARSVPSVNVVFYDGDPQKGGKAFDIERISHLRASDTQQVKVRFRPRECGARQVFVSIGKGTRFETTSASAAVEVVCSQQTPVTLACSTLCQRAAQYYLNNLNRLPGGTVLIAGGGLNSTINTSNMAQMRLALDGGNSAQDRFNQQFAATQLNLLAAPGQDQAALQSLLSCYKLTFAPVRLRNGFTLSPSSSLGELLDQARHAARGSDATELLALAAILGQLNGNDPTGKCSTGIAPSFSTVVQQSLDRALNETMAQYKIPGAVVGVWAPGEGEWITARGVSDLTTKAPMRLDHHFRIGSNTKPFTVTVLLELADGPQPKLHLDDPVSKYLSFVPNGHNITLRMLADMTSGLASYTQNDDFVEALLSTPQRVWRPRELADIGLAMPPRFAPGAGFDYSNTNTVLLGMIIEQVTGQSINEVFTERIFKPLGLSHTIWPTDSALPEPYPHGYTEQTLSGQQADATHWNPSWGYTAGQLISDLEDMKIWAQALGTGTLLSAQMQAERLQSLKLPPTSPTRSYGLGITYENGWLGHTGSLPGYTTSVYYLPAQRATIVVLTNSDIDLAGVRPSSAIFNALAAIVAPGNAP